MSLDVAYFKMKHWDRPLIRLRHNAEHLTGLDLLARPHAQRFLMNVPAALAVRVAHDHQPVLIGLIVPADVHLGKPREKHLP